uniref:DH domain-containing protein n=1 Tax=Clastoptera arizonana TaxID=38151 RepID=A0A1B6E9V0_9HEMI
MATAPYIKCSVNNNDHRPPVSGYVTIGNVRVRLSASGSTVSQPGGDSECCCGVPWPSRSRIPLPSNNRHGIFSSGPSPVYRTSLEWTQQKAPNVVTGCFGKDKVVVRHKQEIPSYYSVAADTERLLQESPCQDTLDRLHRFRFGGGDRGRGGKRNNPGHKKKPRSSDKTERLRELTEKLKLPPNSEKAKGKPCSSEDGGEGSERGVKTVPGQKVERGQKLVPLVEHKQKIVPLLENTDKRASEERQSLLPLFVDRDRQKIVPLTDRDKHKIVPLTDRDKHKIVPLVDHDKNKNSSLSSQDKQKLLVPLKGYTDKQKQVNTNLDDTDQHKLVPLVDDNITIEPLTDLKEKQKNVKPDCKDKIKSVSLVKQCCVTSDNSDNVDDLFECVNLRLPKPESRTIVGAYIQRTIPFRSASFSQVDFTPDGKYIRCSRTLTTSGSLTFPRKKPVDLHIKVPDNRSNTSIDSAVGSAEVLVTPNYELKPIIAESIPKVSNPRSLTHPLTKKGPHDENIAFSSIDGNGLKSLSPLSIPERQLEGVREESDTDSATAQSEPDSHSQLESDQTLTETKSTLSIAETVVDWAESPVTEADSNTNIENSVIDKNESLIEERVELEDENEVVKKDKEDCVTEPLKEDIVNNNTEPPQALETYVAKWPDQSNTVKHGEFDDKTEFSHLKEIELPREENNLNGKENDKNESAETFIECTSINCSSKEEQWPSEKSKRWSDEGTSGDRTSNEWASSAQEEPQSPEEVNVKLSWTPRGKRWPERPRLVCQSSEEKDDDSARNSPRRYHLLTRTDSLSEGESDPGDRRPTTPSRERDRTASPSLFGPSDQSDCESRFGNSCGIAKSPHTPRRYSKRPLRGPYGQMLEAEMKKPETSRKFSKLQYTDDLKFLEDYCPPSPAVANTNNNRLSLGSNRLRAVDDFHLKRSYTSPDPPSPQPRASPKRKVSANIPYSAPNPPTSTTDTMPVIYHQRTTSSPSQLEGCSSNPKVQRSPQPNPQFLAQLLKGSSERAYLADINSTIPPQHWKDTRTHVVVELYDTERSYVESLQILVMKYLQPLKSPENAGLVDVSLVDEIFYQVPTILTHHEEFLEELRKRLEHWDVKQRVGDIFLDTFTKQSVIDTYTSFINNWKTAKEAIKTTCQAKPAFARFLEAMAREHKGKLALDSLLIMPVQRIPRYELLIQTLLKHTEPNHPDHQPLIEAQRQVHALAVRINCTERDSLELEQLEGLIEGLMHLVAPDRTFLRHDLVTMASGQGRKERAFFLFSDLLIITSIKRRSGTIRKSSTNCPGTVASALEANKYKLLMKVSLDDLEIVKAKDESVRRMMREMDNLVEDVATLSQMSELVSTLHCPHSQLEDNIREMLSALNKQLVERQNNESQLSYLELMLNTQSGIDNISIIFSKPDKRSSWEEAFNEAKQRLALSADKRPSPEFMAPVPIRKTRAGLQFTCAAPTLNLNNGSRDVWVCNSDGYVGQVCVLSLKPEPTVTSCNGVCNARILCIAAIPAGTTDSSSSEGEDEPDDSQDVETNTTNKVVNTNLVHSSNTTDDDTDNLQPTMWLGTEDGCIHVYNCSDNIRIKKNKVKIQHGSAVHCIIYLDNRVYVSLANGDVSIYTRDSHGGWNTNDPYTVSVGTVTMPVTKMVPISGRLWCSCHSIIKVLNTSSLNVEHYFSASGETQKCVSCLVVSGLGVWVSLQNSAVVRLFHATSYECLGEVNIAPSVTKMLASCDDIIRQHKAACLRVTSLLACKDLLWVGTSAGVVLTMPLPHISASTCKVSNNFIVTGVPHGHTGHVRFLTVVETKLTQTSEHRRFSSNQSKSDTSSNFKLLVISGGDGYEDFRSASMSEVAGREDSTNHLLLWHV